MTDHQHRLEEISALFGERKHRGLPARRVSHGGVHDKALRSREPISALPRGEALLRRVEVPRLRIQRDLREVFGPVPESACLVEIGAPNVRFPLFVQGEPVEGDEVRGQLAFCDERLHTREQKRAVRLDH